MGKNDNLYSEGLEQFPLKTVVTENGLYLLWFALGAYLCWRFMPVIGFVYLGFGVLMSGYIMRIIVCGNCYYYGKGCHTGWGKLSAMFCKKGDIENFGAGISGVVIPFFYGSMALVPVVFSVIVNIRSFSAVLTALTVVFVFVVYMSAYKFRTAACSVCKMKYVCPGSNEQKEVS